MMPIPIPTKALAIAVGVLVLALAGAGLLLKLSYEANGELRTRLEAANAVIKQREEDAKANAIAVVQLAQKLNDTETKVITQVERVYAAPVTRDCAQSPAMRAASDGLRQLFPGGQAGDRRQPAAGVR
jgi:hypothetical protein